MGEKELIFSPIFVIINTMKEYLTEAEKLSRKAASLPELVYLLKNYLDTHFSNLEHNYKTRSLLESRFTPPEIAFNIGMKSCGSLVNIVTDMLRHVGYKVKKIHGSIPKSKDHAWIRVKNPESKEWQDFDLTNKNLDITPEYTEIVACDDWNDLEEYILQNL